MSESSALQAAFWTCSDATLQRLAQPVDEGRPLLVSGLDGQFRPIRAEDTSLGDHGNPVQRFNIGDRFNGGTTTVIGWMTPMTISSTGTMKIQSRKRLTMPFNKQVQ